MIWTHIVGLFFEAAILAFLFFAARPVGLLRIVRRAPLAVAFAILANAALAAYYLWTKSQGVEANPIGRTSLMGVLFWMYEFGGFAGLGPSRDELRTGSFAVIQSFAAAFAFLAVAWLAVAWLGVRRLAMQVTAQAAALSIFLVLLPLAAFMIVGYLEGVRFLPRYAATSYAAFVVIGATLLCSSWHQGLSGKIAAGCLLMLLLTSSLALRFSPLHLKDDYRTATSQALESLRLGAHVWWGGDVDTARYYGLPNPADVPRDERSFETAWELRDAPGETPDIVYLSKFDVYDSASTIRNVLEDHGYQQRTGPKTFTIWEKPRTTVSP